MTCGQCYYNDNHIIVRVSSDAPRTRFYRSAGSGRTSRSIKAGRMSDKTK